MLNCNPKNITFSITTKGTQDFRTYTEEEWHAKFGFYLSELHGFLTYAVSLEEEQPRIVVLLNDESNPYVKSCLGNFIYDGANSRLTIDFDQYSIEFDYGEGVVVFN